MVRADDEEPAPPEEEVSFPRCRIRLTRLRVDELLPERSDKAGNQRCLDLVLHRRPDTLKHTEHERVCRIEDLLDPFLSRRTRDEGDLLPPDRIVRRGVIGAVERLRREAGEGAVHPPVLLELAGVGRARGVVAVPEVGKDGVFKPGEAVLR